MHPAIHRLLCAYRPLYLNGVLKDGHFRLPTGRGPDASTVSAKPRALLVALLPLARTHRR